MNAELTWLQAHERLILVIVGLAATVYIGRNWLNKYYDNASEQVKASTATLLNQQQVNRQLQEQFNQIQQQTQQLVLQMQAQNSQLAAKSTAAIQQAVQQQTLDSQRTNQQLADRIAELANQKNVQANDQGVQLNHDQSVGVTQKLEDVPALQAELQNYQQIELNNNKEITGLISENQQCTSTNQGLKQELEDQKTKDAAELKKAKVSGLRSKFRWFFTGVVTGFVAGKIW